MAGPVVWSGRDATESVLNDARSPGINPRRRQMLGALACLPMLGKTRAETTEVIYAWPESLRADARSVLPIQLLKAALRRSGEGFRALPAPRDLTQSRSLRHLQLDRGLDVAWTLTSTERERHLIPVRIPLDKGLLGWRLPLIRALDAGALASLPDAASLRALRCAQGHDWPDFRVLADNGFHVTPAPTYESLFQMLARRRVVHVPRSLAEIRPEIASHPALDLAVAPDWVLHYPAPLYFFVNPQRPRLAAAIEHGLRQMLVDGDFDQRFFDRYGAELRAAALSTRRVVELSNQQLPPLTPLADEALWLDPRTFA
ncbi:hypothetical protein [Pseudomarimonas salicorniae]|uniref:Extracellular solute-binding protein, family 3 n=1 Tax=Pseudomarimonas salicorniae TaxID=2933270 RepID=A0ABT0GKC9_9GAMM|nr:hypothetical protein [Lysobacter sp. CAU 1642]MCK7594991.1 hypothetical protein [Lysobacter sp. CAU 1642]